MKLFAILAGWAILAIASQTATAQFVLKIPNPNQGPAKPAPAAPAPSRTMLIKYVDVKQGAFMGKPAMILTGKPIDGGAMVHLAIWNGPLAPAPGPGVKPTPASNPAPPPRTDKPNPNPAIMSVLDNAKPGDCLRLVVFGIGARSRVRQAQPYDLKPGEDEPNVYFFVDKSQEKVGDVFRKTVTVSRFGENIGMIVPTVDGEPSAEIMQVIEGATANETMLEITTVKSGANLTIKTAKVFEPPRELVFVKVTTQKDLTAVEVKDGEKSQTIAINPKAANSAALLKKIKDFKAGQAVLVRSTKDDDGTWLVDIKAKEGKATPTSRPETMPTSKPG